MLDITHMIAAKSVSQCSMSFHFWQTANERGKSNNTQLCVQFLSVYVCVLQITRMNGIESESFEARF